MTNEQWQQVKDIFSVVVELPPDERKSFIEEKAGGDYLIIREVRALLDSDEGAENFIENPLVAVSQLVRDETALTGKKIGSYLIEREIGRGGMGAVYRASRADEHFEKRVAIKLIKRGFDTDDIIRRFRHERQILAALDHPNITRLLDGGATDDGLPYLVMDYVEGLPLTRYCEDKEFSVNERLNLFLQICSAVIYAHRNLIIHRDIKPSNILVTPGGVPKLLDFGIAKLMALDSPQTIERHSTQMMTPEYASPEQILGQPVTTATDIYSLGVVLYELLTRHRPFRIKGNNALEISKAITDSAPLKPSSIVTQGRKTGNGHWAVSVELRGDLDNIILMAIRKEPDRRYSSVEQFAADINRYLRGLPVAARQDTFSYRASKFIQRNKAAVAAGAGVFAALVGGLAATKRQAKIARRQRDKAEEINQFLQKMLASANPRSVGKDIKVIEVLSIAAESLETDFPKQPEIAADLETTLGLTYLSLGQLESAEKHLKSALYTRQAVFPRKSLEVARSFHNYGKLLVEQSDFTRAEALYMEALRTLRQLFGNKNAEVAEVLESLGYLTGLQARYEESLRFYEEELNLQRALLGKNHPDVARTMGKLGNVWTVLDRREIAEPLHRQSLKILRKLHGRGHPDISSSIFNLVGTIYLEHPEEAERLCLESVAMCRKILGEEHADTIWALYNLAYVLIHRRKYAEAEFSMREALAKRGANLPDEHVVVGSSLLLLGRALIGQGKYGEAKAAFEECLALRRRTLPAGHWQLATTGSFLGECLANLGEIVAGERMMLENYEIIREKLGANHRQTLQALERLREFQSKRKS
ncbi:MAG TPA: serine/threonine-protein kinase [Pyrinomonadaceae bacterium]